MLYLDFISMNYTADSLSTEMKFTTLYNLNLNISVKHTLEMFSVWRNTQLSESELARLVISCPSWTGHHSDICVSEKTGATVTHALLSSERGRGAGDLL